MSRDKKKRVGWMHRTEGNPKYIIAYMGNADGGRDRESFPDNKEGALASSDWVTAHLGRDDWRLEDMQFLGYRIYVPAEECTCEKIQPGCYPTMEGYHHPDCDMWDPKASGPESESE